MKTAALSAAMQTPNVLDTTGPAAGSGQEESFAGYLSRALQDVESLQEQAHNGGGSIASGQEDYIHNTVLAYEKANLALQLTIQVRDKVVEAFQEFMRIQM